MKNSRRRLLAGLASLPFGSIVSQSLISQVIECEEKNFIESKWVVSIDSTELSIRPRSDTNFIFSPIETKNIYLVSNIYGNYSETPVYKNKELQYLEDDPETWSSAPLEIVFRINNWNNQLNRNIYVRNIYGDHDQQDFSVRYSEDTEMTKGEKAFIFTSNNGEKLLVDGIEPNIQIITDDEKFVFNARQTTLRPSLSPDKLINSNKITIAYAINEKVIYSRTYETSDLRQLFQKYEKVFKEQIEKLSNETPCPVTGETSHCFISTAVCEHIGLTDDCWELKQLRLFRDTYLLNQINGISLISEYYDKAPKLVERIRSFENYKIVYTKLYWREILVCAILSKLKLNKLTLWKYKSMMKKLEKTYLNLAAKNPV